MGDLEVKVARLEITSGYHDKAIEELKEEGAQRGAVLNEIHDKVTKIETSANVGWKVITAVGGLGVLIVGLLYKAWSMMNG